MIKTKKKERKKTLYGPRQTHYAYTCGSNSVEMDTCISLFVACFGSLESFKIAGMQETNREREREKKNRTLLPSDAHMPLSPQVTKQCKRAIHSEQLACHGYRHSHNEEKQRFFMVRCHHNGFAIFLRGWYQKASIGEGGQTQLCEHVVLLLSFIFGCNCMPVLLEKTKW